MSKRKVVNFEDNEVELDYVKELIQLDKEQNVLKKSENKSVTIYDIYEKKMAKPFFPDKKLKI